MRKRSNTLNEKYSLMKQKNDKKKLKAALQEVLSSSSDKISAIEEDIKDFREMYNDYGDMINKLVGEYKDMRNTEMHKALLVCDDIVPIFKLCLNNTLKELETCLHNTKIRSINACKHLK
jgi:hypothetical protein